MLERYTLTTAQRFGIVHGQFAPWQGHGGKRRPPIHEVDAGTVRRAVLTALPR